jgi:ankyrin repeat protein
LKSAVQKDWSGDGLLSIACWHGRIETALMLITDFDVNVNDKNNMNQTPLHRSCAQNNIEMAMMLCRKGADLSLKDKVQVLHKY